MDVLEAMKLGCQIIYETYANWESRHPYIGAAIAATKDAGKDAAKDALTGGASSALKAAGVTK